MTGATGNVGTSVIEALSADPEVGSIVGVARRKPEWTADKTTWHTADVLTDNLVEIFAGADVVIHLAWQFQPTHQPVTTWEANVLGSVRVFDAVAAARVPTLVYASSVGAYSPGPKDVPVAESWPTHGWPDAAYTREKAYIERVLDSFELAQPDVRVVRMRPGFLFKRESASQQRRLFAGRLLPVRRLRPPIVPDLPGLRFQALHTADAAQAYVLAARSDIRGPVNLAADPVVDPVLLAECLGARVVAAPAWPVRMALSAAWRLHLVPAAPGLFDAVLRLPIMDCTRARTELGWTPRQTSRAAIAEFLGGLRDGAGMDTAPLHPESETAVSDEVIAGSR
ncbi:MAG TPA: NAD-dependent epimerase/dehydratase family protein [Micromonosporaceae bacterium]|nr:NAD-dependent epimerase/dehydratase family protein [Micromonosporaceae bacterium]